MLEAFKSMEKKSERYKRSDNIKQSLFLISSIM